MILNKAAMVTPMQAVVTVTHILIPIRTHTVLHSRHAALTSNAMSKHPSEHTMQSAKRPTVKMALLNQAQRVDMQVMQANICQSNTIEPS